jgi:hypothetical protein
MSQQPPKERPSRRKAARPEPKAIRPESRTPEASERDTRRDPEEEGSAGRQPD